MRFCFLLLCFFILNACQKKETEPNCVKWRTLYWQGKADRTTVTSSYLPYNGEKEVCGAGKDTVQRDKTIILSQVNANLFNYMTFQAQIR